MAAYEQIMARSNNKKSDTLTLDECNTFELDKLEPNSLSNEFTSRKAIFKQILTTCAVLILSAASGMPMGYSAVLLPQLMSDEKNTTENFIISREMGSWITSMHSLGTPVGSFISGPLADSIGRRTTLLLATLPLLLGWTTLALSKSIPSLILGRFICGFAVSLMAGPAQVYIAETVEANLRSLLIGAPSLLYSIGILIVYLLGSFMHWRTVAWCGYVLPILAAMAMLCIPESPTWLLRHDRIAQAQWSLKFLHCSELRAQREFNKMMTRLECERTTQTQANENILKLCCKRAALKPLMIVTVLCFLQMFSGCFIVVFYAVDIIAEFGGELDTKVVAVWTAVVRSLCTLIFCVVLLFVRRRGILIASGMGSGISCLILSIYMYVNVNEPVGYQGVIFAVIFLLAYVATNTPLMVMPAVMIGELFPARIRGRTAGGLYFINNCALFAIAKAFPFLQSFLKMQGVFIIFAVSSFLVSIFMALFQPETKGRTLEQIEDYFNEDHWLWCHRGKKYKKVSNQKV